MTAMTALAASPALPAVEAFQACLAAEHAVVYGYGVLGGRLARVGPGSTTETLVEAAYAEHRGLRDQLLATVLDLGAEPVAAEPAYATPDLADVGDCRQLARDLEQRCAAVYADAVAETLDDARELAALSLRGCAIRATRLDAPVETYPGLTGR